MVFIDLTLTSKITLTTSKKKKTVINSIFVAFFRMTLPYAILRYNFLGYCLFLRPKAFFFQKCFSCTHTELCKRPKKLIVSSELIDTQYKFNLNQ